VNRPARSHRLNASARGIAVDAEPILDACILIVDDSGVTRATIVAHLRAAGFSNIIQAVDGVDGLQRARAHHPELVITDLMMPNMDGFELCRRLRAEPDFAQVPILVETAMEKPEQRVDVFDAGASDLICKPLNVREFIGRVRVHLERGRLIERLSEYQRRMNQELYQARIVQAMLLPTDVTVAQMQARYPLQLASHYEASIGIGGDFWGIDAIDPDRCRIFCADFAGHGVSAALNTFRLHAFISREALDATEPHEWLMRLNAFLCDVLPVGQYATMFCAVVDFRLGTLQYAAACAPPPMVLSAGGDAAFHAVDGAGVPLGIRADATYESRAVAFPTGSVLFVYSDALIETPDALNPIFDHERLCAFLNRHRRIDRPAALQQAVLKELQSDGPPCHSDDLTTIVLRHTEARRR
jgi:phosphoserine phosphatase RsbU/P